MEQKVINSHKIYLIEQSLDELENTDDTQLLENLSRFFTRVCNALDLAYDAHDYPDPRDGFDVLFRRKNSRRQKNFVAVSLLRLLCHNEAVLWNHSGFRIKTCRLFDDQISSIYSRFNILQDDQNDLKLGKLLGSEKSVLDNFQEIADSVVSLDGIPAVRRKFMRTLNSDLNGLFLEQFVTPSFLINDERINQIFAAAQVYQESLMVDRVGAFQDLKDIIDPFLNSVGKYPSIFTKHCIVAPLKKIYDAIREDFESNDATKATNVVISKLDRKYPLHEKNRELELKFQVTNSGPGYAFDIQINCEETQGLAPINPVNLGTLQPKHSAVIVLPTSVKTVVEKGYEVLLTLSWWNYDKSEQNSEAFLFDLPPQPADLDWDVLKGTKPYILEPVNTAEHLVGRKGLVAQLTAKLSAERIESSFIHGQKRVGKTSIAEVVQANFENNPDYSVVFISIIGHDTTTPQSFIAPLGRRIVRLVSRSSKSIKAGIQEPSFEGSLSPLVEYFEEARDILPNHKFIIILDEFDEIPQDMIQVGNNAGQAFFNNIRAISSTGYVGFLLVGGENMQIILESTDQLNKMTSFRVDYFDKEKYWDDFQELVRRPVKGTIEFNDEAINALYEMTEGHPYYTKAICSEIFTTTCEDRNAYITEDNVHNAVRDTTKSLDLNAVSHFWIDGISKRHAPPQRDIIQTQRRRFLIAFAQIKRRKKTVGIQDLRDSPLLRNLDVDKNIEQYITRGFLIEDEETGNLRWRPRFFERWLIERGFSMLTGEFLDEEAVLRLKEKEEKAYVSDSEIVELSDAWKSYRGAPITPLHVRAWLEQFEYNTEQRFMFALLKQVNFFSLFRIREKIGELHEAVQKIIARAGASRPWDRRQARSDILLSSLESSPAKSGVSCARIYAQENNIYVDNAVFRDDIRRVLTNNSQIRAIVFVDDIIASGGTAEVHLNWLIENVGELIRKQQLMVFVTAVCGLRRGLEKVKTVVDNASLSAQVRVVVGDLLDETDQCFSDQSGVFSSSQDRNEARSIAKKYGTELDGNQPLGYDDSQLLVVFHDNCPNNTLPILWKESISKPKWKPLFQRS